MDPTEDPRETRRKLVQEHLGRVWKRENQTCPICGADDWNINDAAAVPIRALGGTFFMETPIYPLAPIVCVNCGYTFFVNEKWARGDKPSPQ